MSTSEIRFPFPSGKMVVDEILKDLQNLLKMDVVSIESDSFIKNVIDKNLSITA